MPESKKPISLNQITKRVRITQLETTIKNFKQIIARLKIKDSLGQLKSFESRLLKAEKQLEELRS